MGARPGADASTTSRASGRPPATTTTATHGGSSATGATERRRPDRLARRRPCARSSPRPPRARTLVLDVPGWPGHRAGQHVDVRLTAEDGYQAQRSYSIASAPEDRRARADRRAHRRRRGLALPRRRAARRRPVRAARADRRALHLARRATAGPLLLVGGGSGLVPLMAMLRHRAAARQRRRRAAARLGAQPRRTCSTATSSSGSSRRAGCTSPARSRATPPPGWDGFARRVDADDAGRGRPAAAERARAIFVCGPDAVRRGAWPTCSSTLGHDPRTDPRRALRPDRRMR